MYYETDYLAHYGVLGMKWGVRKAEKYEKRAGEYAIKAKKETTDTQSRDMYKTLSKQNKSLAKGQRDLVGKYNNKADRKSIKKDAKRMKKYGMKDSIKDQLNGQGTKFFNDLAKAKGKDYAEAVSAKTYDKLNKQFVRSGIVFAASMTALTLQMLK